MQYRRVEKGDKSLIFLTPQKNTADIDILCISFSVQFLSSGFFVFNIYVMNMYLYLLQNTLSTEKEDYLRLYFSFCPGNWTVRGSSVSLVNPRAHEVLRCEDARSPLHLV